MKFWNCLTVSMKVPPPRLPFSSQSGFTSALFPRLTSLVTSSALPESTSDAEAAGSTAGVAAGAGSDFTNAGAAGAGSATAATGAGSDALAFTGEAVRSVSEGASVSIGSLAFGRSAAVADGPLAAASKVLAGGATGAGGAGGGVMSPISASMTK